jgi:type VI secretion system protein ImpA
MSELDLEALLKPISEDSPCGGDLEYAPEFLALMELARGRPEQEIGDSVRPAQDPPWQKVREAAEALFDTTKDLRVAGTLHHALMKTKGVSGFASSMMLISSLLECYWEHLHPMLDVEDDNDPTFRVNALVTAVAGEDALAILRAVPLLQSRQFGSYSLRSHRIAAGLLQVKQEDGENADPAKELARIESAASDIGVEALQAVAANVQAASGALNSIQKVLLERADGIPVQFGDLSAEIKEMQTFIAGQLARLGAGGTADVPTAQDDTGQSPASNAAAGISGEVRSRADVTRALDRICDYYRRTEPASPIPLLLERARRLIDKDFMAILRDLTPGGVSEAEIFVGRNQDD